MSLKKKDIGNYMRKEDYNRAKEIFRLVDCLDTEKTFICNQLEAIEKRQSTDICNERITLYTDTCCHPPKIIITVEEYIHLLNGSLERLTGRINELLQEFDELGEKQ